jgi:hypothetical protein
MLILVIPQDHVRSVKQPGSFAMWYPSVTSAPRTMAHGGNPSLKLRAE